MTTPRSDVAQGSAHSAAPSRLPDEDVLAAFLRGDEAMFSELVHRYEKPLYGFICRAGGDPSNAADIFQETFVRVFQRASTFSGQSSFKTWLYAVALNE